MYNFFVLLRTIVVVALAIFAIQSFITTLNFVKNPPPLIKPTLPPPTYAPYQCPPGQLEKVLPNGITECFHK